MPFQLIFLTIFVFELTGSYVRNPCAIERRSDLLIIFRKRG